MCMTERDGDHTPHGHRVLADGVLPVVPTGLPSNRDYLRDAGEQRWASDGREGGAPLPPEEAWTLEAFNSPSTGIATRRPSRLRFC